MTQDLAISLLKKGSKGFEILQILDTISIEDLVENDDETTSGLEEIQF